MLLRFNVSNWKSFREIKFSAIASKEHTHGKRISKLDRYRIRILPVSAVYGGNAAGKTNFFSALNFMRQFVIRGNAPGNLINIEPFALSQKARNQPSVFNLEILVDNVIYAYSFTASKIKILEESLTKIGPSSETILFARIGDNYEFCSELQENKSLRYVSEGTQPNILFLTNTVFQRKEEFLHIYNWFRKTLVLIAPDTRFEAFETFMDENSPTHDSNSELLKMFDTGVVHTSAVEVPLDQVPFSREFKEGLKTQLPQGTIGRVNNNFDHEKYLFRNTDGGLTATKMVTVHASPDDGQEVVFEMKDESDGTLRLLDLIPMLHQLMDNKTSRVFIVDEIDRSFHYLLTKKILELYLDSCTTEPHSQLLFTTHDLLLMDQKLFRRDEMWITERTNGQSVLMSIGDFQLRYDKDVLKAYLDGRFGGIPKIY